MAGSVFYMGDLNVPKIAGVMQREFAESASTRKLVTGFAASWQRDLLETQKLVGDLDSFRQVRDRLRQVEGVQPDQSDRLARTRAPRAGTLDADRLAIVIYIAMVAYVLWKWFDIEHPMAADLLRDEVDPIMWIVGIAATLYTWMGPKDRS